MGLAFDVYGRLFVWFFVFFWPPQHIGHPARSWPRQTVLHSYKHLSFDQILSQLFAETGQPDGDIFLCKPHKPGDVPAAVGKPLAAYKENAVFDGQRVQISFDDMS